MPRWWIKAAIQRGISLPPSPFKVVLLLFSSSKNFCSRDMRMLFAADSFRCRLLRAARMLSECRQLHLGGKLF